MFTAGAPFVAVVVPSGMGTVEVFNVTWRPHPIKAFTTSHQALGQSHLLITGLFWFP